MAEWKGLCSSNPSAAPFWCVPWACYPASWPLPSFPAQLPSNAVVVRIPWSTQCGVLLLNDQSSIPMLPSPLSSTWRPVQVTLDTCFRTHSTDVTGLGHGGS